MKYAMIVVDFQKGIVDDSLYNKDKVIGNIKDLLQFGREKDLTIIYVRHNDGPSGVLKKGERSFEIYDEVAPKDGEEIFDKDYNSIFKNTGLKEYLKDKHITNLIIMGLQTEYCIDASLKAGVEHGYRMIIPEDTVTTKDNGEFTAKQLNDFYYNRIWNGRFAKVLSVEKVKNLF